MTDLKFRPVRHDHKAFIEKATKRKGFVETYDALALKYRSANQALKGRSSNCLTQDDQVAYHHD